MLESYSPASPTAHPEEHSPELLAERAVHQEVDRRVESDQEVGNPHQVRPEKVEQLQHVDEHGGQVANEEDTHYADEHGCQADLFLFPPGEVLAVLVGDADGAEDSQVEDGQSEKRDEVHDEKVQPNVVDL